MILSHRGSIFGRINSNSKFFRKRKNSNFYFSDRVNFPGEKFHENFFLHKLLAEPEVRDLQSEFRHFDDGVFAVERDDDDDGDGDGDGDGHLSSCRQRALPWSAFLGLNDFSFLTSSSGQPNMHPLYDKPPKFVNSTKNGKLFLAGGIFRSRSLSSLFSHLSLISSSLPW